MKFNKISKYKPKVKKIQMKKSPMFEFELSDEPIVKSKLEANNVTNVVKGIQINKTFSEYQEMNSKAKTLKYEFDDLMKSGNRDKAKQKAIEYNNYVDEIESFVKKNKKQLMKRMILQRKYDKKMKSAIKTDRLIRQVQGED